MHPNGRDGGGEGESMGPFAGIIQIKFWNRIISERTPKGHFVPPSIKFTMTNEINSEEKIRLAN